MQISRAGNARIVVSGSMQDFVRSMIWDSFVSCEIIVETANWIYPGILLQYEKMVSLSREASFFKMRAGGFIYQNAIRFACESG